MYLCLSIVTDLPTDSKLDCAAWQKRMVFSGTRVRRQKKIHSSASLTHTLQRQKMTEQHRQRLCTCTETHLNDFLSQVGQTETTKYAYSDERASLAFELSTSTENNDALSSLLGFAEVKTAQISMLVSPIGVETFHYRHPVAACGYPGVAMVGHVALMFSTEDNSKAIYLSQKGADTVILDSTAFDGSGERSVLVCNKVQVA